MINNKYVAYHKQIERRMDGSSGGVCTAIIETLLKDDYFFCGAVWSESLSVHHIVSNNPEDIEKIAGFKPVESELGDVPNMILNIIKTGGKVVFVGTRKQCDEINKKIFNHESLILVELVTSPLLDSQILVEYRKFLEDKFGCKVSNIQFSNREFNDPHSKRITLEDGRTEFIRNSDYFEELELSGKYTKPNTHHESLINPIGDFTIGAYLIEARADDHLGYTFVSVNSERANKIFDRCKKRICIIKQDADVDLKRIQTSPIVSNSNYSRSNFLQKCRAILAGIKYANWRLTPTFQFIYYNFLSGKIKTDIKNRGLLYIYPNAVFKLVKGCCIELHGPLFIGTRRIKDSKLETRLRMEYGSRIIVRESCSFGAGSNVEIYKNAILEVGELNSNAELNIICGEKIVIGSPCNIARNATVRDTSGHIIATPGYKQSKPIIIGNHTWICTESTIMPGVNIGDGAIVSACSFVTKKVPPFSIVQGIPALEVSKVKYFHI